MIILQESASAQLIRFIPRSSGYDTIELTDEQTNEITTITTFTPTTGDYYDMISAIFPVVQDHFYSLKIKDGSDVLYRDKVFCTNQPIASFSVNNGQYTTNPTNNDFIIYE